MSRCSSANVFGGSGTPSGVCTVARRSVALRRVGLKLRMPSRTRVDFIRFTIRVRSPTKPSRSRFGRLASSSAIVGTRAMLQWPRSPRSHPRNPRFSNSVSSRSVFARRCSRDTATLEGWMTCASTPRAASQRASQKPSRPASKATAIRVIVRPALTDSSRQRCSRAKQPLRARLQLLARLTLNAGKHPANQPARPAHLDDGNDRAILVQGHEGPAQIVRLGHRGTPSIDVSDEIAILVPLARAWLACRKLARRADPPGATVAILCLKHLGETCAPADWPRRMPCRKLRPRAPVQGAAGVVTARALFVKGINMAEEETISWFAGVDWGSERHQVCLLDARGTIAGECEFPHSGEGLAELGDWLVSMAGDASTVAVAIEVPHGPVVDALIDRGFVVYAINHKQIDPLRGRCSVAGAKNDRRDPEPVGQAVELFGIDCIHDEPSIDQRIDDRSVWYFNCNGDRTCVACH